MAHRIFTLQEELKGPAGSRPGDIFELDALNASVKVPMMPSSTPQLSGRLLILFYYHVGVPLRFMILRL